MIQKAVQETDEDLFSHLEKSTEQETNKDPLDQKNDNSEESKNGPIEQQNGNTEQQQNDQVEK